MLQEHGGGVQCFVSSILEERGASGIDEKLIQDCASVGYIAGYDTVRLYNL